MNPDTPQPAGLEVKISALLLGELPPDEAAAMRWAISQDAELMKLHRELKLAVELMREAIGNPTQQTGAQPAPLRLSEARRQELLAHFKTVTPKEFQRARRRLLRQLVPLAAAVAAICFIGGALLSPSLAKSKHKAMTPLAQFHDLNGAIDSDNAQPATRRPGAAAGAAATAPAPEVEAEKWRQEPGQAPLNLARSERSTTPDSPQRIKDAGSPADQQRLSGVSSYNDIESHNIFDASRTPRVARIRAPAGNSEMAQTPSPAQHAKADIVLPSAGLPSPANPGGFSTTYSIPASASDGNLTSGLRSPSNGRGLEQGDNADNLLAWDDKVALNSQADKTPLLGDLPIVGRHFRSMSENAPAAGQALPSVAFDNYGNVVGNVVISGDERDLVQGRSQWVPISGGNVSGNPGQPLGTFPSASRSAEVRKQAEPTAPGQPPGWSSGANWSIAGTLHGFYDDNAEKPATSSDSFFSPGFAFNTKSGSGSVTINNGRLSGETITAGGSTLNFNGGSGSFSFGGGTERSFSDEGKPASGPQPTLKGSVQLAENNTSTGAGLYQMGAANANALQYGAGNQNAGSFKVANVDSEQALGVQDLFSKSAKAKSAAQKEAAPAAKYASPGEVGNATFSVDPSTHNSVVVADERTRASIDKAIKDIDRQKAQESLPRVIVDDYGNVVSSSDGRGLVQDRSQWVPISSGSAPAPAALPSDGRTENQGQKFYQGAKPASGPQATLEESGKSVAGLIYFGAIAATNGVAVASSSLTDRVRGLIQNSDAVASLGVSALSDKALEIDTHLVGADSAVYGGGGGRSGGGSAMTVGSMMNVPRVSITMTNGQAGGAGYGGGGYGMGGGYGSGGYGSGGYGSGGYGSGGYGSGAYGGMSAVPGAYSEEELKKSTRNAGTLVQDGKALYEMGKLDEADRELDQALKLDPQNQGANYYKNLITENRYSDSPAKRDVDSRLQVEKSWENNVNKNNLPVPNAYARTNLIYTSPKRQETVRKLDQIVVDSIDYQGLPLNEVVKNLVDEAKRRDPERRGLNFLIDPNSTLATGGQIDPATGQATPVEQVDLGTAKINLDPPVRDLSLHEVLDAVVRMADKPLKYSIEDYGIVFTTRKPADDQLSVRVIRVDPNAFLQGMMSGGYGDGGYGGVMNVPRVSMTARTGQSGEGGSLSAVTGGYQSSQIQQMANKFVTDSVGVDLAWPKALTFNDREGTLTVKGTAEDLDKIDAAVRALNSNQPQKNIAQPAPVVPPPAPPPPPAAPEPIPQPTPAPPPIPQPEVQTRDNAFSTFSLNVSDVSYKLTAASLAQGLMPEPASIRTEEFINAFNYHDPEAAPGAPLAFAWERAHYPFAYGRDLLRFSVKTAAEGRQAGKPLNLVLLLDNSGSMERADRVEIIHQALRVLASQLHPQDKLSVVLFSRTARLWADGLPGDQAGKVAEELSGLTPEGGTNLEEAMKLAYATALRHYLADGMNRVVLLTDGAANLGEVQPESLKVMVDAHRKQGIALDCFGIGWEGYNDDLLEVLTRNGNGRYGFVNTPEAAATEFAAQLAGALHVAASDVKVQVEFNPSRVTSYRQLGYAKHQLTKEQFRDNKVTAAEIAAQEAGNALYVVEVKADGQGPLATVRVRYRVPGTSDYHEHEWEVPYEGNAVGLDQASAAMKLAGTASAFSEWLAASPYAAEVTTGKLMNLMRGVPEACGADPRPKQLETMITQARSVSGR